MDDDKKPTALVPYLCTRGAESAIAFYTQVFNAKEIERYQEAPDAPIGHATLNIEGAQLFLSDEFPEISVLSPQSIGGTPVTLYLTVPNVDQTAALAIQNGAKLLREPADQPYGQRNAKLIDPFGHVWMIATPL